MEVNLGEHQFGFRQGMGESYNILALRMIAERRLNMNRSTYYIGFIDLEKAFDTVNWNLLMTTLKRTGLDCPDRIIIMELHKDQETIIIIGDCVFSARFLREVRQGCSLLPPTYSIYS